MKSPFLCYDRKSLETILPHRGAALRKIDGVLYVPGGGSTVTGVKDVREDDPDLEGHFPGDPTYPGYAQDEFVCLVAATIIPIVTGSLTNNPHVVQKIARYKKRVTPGDTLVAEVRLLQARGQFYIFDALLRNQRNEIVAAYDKIVGAVPQRAHRVPALSDQAEAAGPASPAGKQGHGEARPSAHP